MKHLTTVLILVLASANAFNYPRPDRQFQQEPKEMPYLAIALNEEQFLPLVEEAAKWESPFDPRMVLFNDLNSLENFLQEDPNEYRIKRTKPSLSIDNPLDVLRKQFFKAYARRMKTKYIEENKEQLMKAGKRSGKEISSPISLLKESDYQSQKDFTENETENQSNEQNLTTRRYQSSLEDLSYQT